MISFDDERKEQLDDVFARYAIQSLEDAKNICTSKNIDVNGILSKTKQDIPEVAGLAYTLGAAIAIKKNTKLASYVAMDIGEGIQSFCTPGTDAAETHAGISFGHQVSNKIKKTTDETAMIDYASLLDFMGMSNEELTKAAVEISNKVEEVMQGE